MKSIFLDEQDLIIYPSSDGKRMAENTRQFNYIVLIKENLEKHFSEDENVFIAGDLLWYPVEGNPKIAAAPDTMVVFGRPKGHRKSYKQFKENNIPPQVVFEILSDANTTAEMLQKTQFYSNYGVEEYYVYDPDSGEFEIYLRQNNQLQLIEYILPYTSRLLNIRFDVNGKDLRLFYPDGRPFRLIKEVLEELDEEKLRADREELRADREELRADREVLRAENEKQKAEKLAAKLRELGINPDEI
jgi:Uma2 family endonuclease